MKVYEIVQRLKRKPQKKAIRATQADVEYFANLYAKYLDRLESVPHVRVDPPTEEETGFLVDVIARMARQGEEI